METRGLNGPFRVSNYLLVPLAEKLPARSTAPFGSESRPSFRPTSKSGD